MLYHSSVFEDCNPNGPTTFMIVYFSTFLKQTKLVSEHVDDPVCFNSKNYIQIIIISYIVHKFSFYYYLIVYQHYKLFP